MLQLLHQTLKKNVAFYTGLLGLRLIKKTVNYDDVSVYYLYYGNETGDPGTILTFFPYTNIAKGRQGNGQLTTISFFIAENTLDFWLFPIKNYAAFLDCGDLVVFWLI